MKKTNYDLKRQLTIFSNNLIVGHISNNDFGLTNSFKVSFKDTMTSKQRKKENMQRKPLTMIQFDKLHNTTVDKILEYSDLMIKNKVKLKEFVLDNKFKVIFRDLKRKERKEIIA